jgi:hypothetical protein
VNRALPSAWSYPVSVPPRCPFAAGPSRCVAVSLLFATRASHPQLHENTAALSPAVAALVPRVDAKLTRVNRNPFVCHSYEKHRGWGMPLQPSRWLFPYAALAHAQKSPHTNARQPKSFHTFTSHFSVYRRVRVAPSSALPVPGACTRLGRGVKSHPPSSRHLNPFDQCSPRHLLSPSIHYSLPTTHSFHVRFTRSIPGATHV